MTDATLVKRCCSSLTVGENHVVNCTTEYHFICRRAGDFNAIKNDIAEYLLHFVLLKFHTLYNHLTLQLARFACQIKVQRRSDIGNLRHFIL